MGKISVHCKDIYALVTLAQKHHLSYLAIRLLPPAKAPGFNFKMKPIVCWTYRVLEENTGKARQGEMGKITCLGVQGVTEVHHIMLSRGADFSIFFVKMDHGGTKKIPGYTFDISEHWPYIHF